MSDLNAFFGAGFETNSVEPAKDYEVLPPGKYPVLIDSAEVKQTKAGTGHYIKLQLTVLDGQYRNRKVFDNINIDNPSTQCVEIGLRSLAALGLALGITAITDTQQLAGQFCIAHVVVRKEQNEVRTYSATGAPAAASAPPAAGPSAAPPPAASQPALGTPLVRAPQAPTPATPVAPAPAPVPAPVAAPAPAPAPAPVAVGTGAPQSPAQPQAPWQR